MPNNTTEPDEVTAVNPAALSEAIRETPVSFVDDLLTDEHGGRVIPKNSREEHRAQKLGDASGQAVTDARIVKELSPHRTKAAGLNERRSEAGHRRVEVQNDYTIKSQACRNADTIPLSTRSHKQKLLSVVAKPGFLLGDTAVMAVVITRSGASELLAILLGLSMALSTVAVGTQFGHILTIAWQRVSRGAAPEDCEVSHRAYYDDGGARTQFVQWLILGGATTGALLLAVTLIGIGEGDPGSLAFGFGLLAALTFGGAAGAEAYGTNAATDFKEECKNGRDDAGATLREFEDLADAAAAETELADTLLVAVQYGAASAATTVEVIADRTTDNPGVFGYDLPGPAAAPKAIVPAGLKPLNATAKTNPPAPRMKRITIPQTTTPTTNGPKSSS